MAAQMVDARRAMMVETSSGSEPEESAEQQAAQTEQTETDGPGKTAETTETETVETSETTADKAADKQSAPEVSGDEPPTGSEAPVDNEEPAASTQKDVPATPNSTESETENKSKTPSTDQSAEPSNGEAKRSSPQGPDTQPPQKRPRPASEEYEPFDPVANGLLPSFSLTKYVECRARKCKVSTTAIDSTLKAAQNSQTDPTKDGSQGLSMDVTILGGKSGRFPGLALLQTQELVYPVVDDPYLLGQVACTALLSNMYSVGVCDVDNILMKLSVSQFMEDKERDIVVPLILKGFRDAAKKAGTRITGGETVINPWCMIGGVATAVCYPKEYIVPDKCCVGDVLVLTKPLGTQIAVNCHQWLKVPSMWQKIKMVVTEAEVQKAYKRAVDVMRRLNLCAAKLMHKYGAHAATTIAGFGLLGHAMALARCQKNEVSFVIHNLPVIAKMASVAKARGQMFPLPQGLVCEMSGGMLICLPREQAAAFCKEIESIEGSQAWIIGIVEKGDRMARIIDKPRVIEVPFKDKDGELW